jgi:hypothetical protein
LFFYAVWAPSENFDSGFYPNTGILRNKPTFSKGTKVNLNVVTYLLDTWVMILGGPVVPL